MMEPPSHDDDHDPGFADFIAGLAVGLLAGGVLVWSLLGVT